MALLVGNGFPSIHSDVSMWTPSQYYFNTIPKDFVFDEMTKNHSSGENVDF